MPLRNTVDTLKTLSAKRVAWPDAVGRESETEPYPSAEQYCRDQIYGQYITEFMPQGLGSSQERLTRISETIVNSWITLSNLYQTTLEEFKHLEPFLQLQPPKVIDFLQEGFISSHDLDCDKFRRFVITVPRRYPSQAITDVSWNAIVNSLEENEVIRHVKELYIRFRAPSTRVHGHFDFDRPFMGFTNLTRLVARGGANNSLLRAVGFNCYHLRYLDITESLATMDGVRLLFFLDSASEKEYRKKFKTSMLTNLPRECLQPLTRTLKYFDMSFMPNIEIRFHSLEESILMACPQLVTTPTRFFFRPVGKHKLKCNNFHHDPTLLLLRQALVLHVRSKLCDNLLSLVRGFIACLNITFPSFEVRVNEEGCEIGFLLFSNGRVVAYFELENLLIVNFINYARSTCQFVPLELLGRCLPHLQRIKSPLAGAISEKYPLDKLKHVSIHVAHRLLTLKSIIQGCPNLQYLEVVELLLHPKYLDDDDIDEIFRERTYMLEVIRILFANKITLGGGLSRILRCCPSLRVIGDLRRWAAAENLFYKLHNQVKMHNFQLVIEYDGILFNSDKLDISGLEVMYDNKRAL